MPTKSKMKSSSTTTTTIHTKPEKYKSYIEEKKKEIQKKFTDFVTSNNITFIYGGKTTKTVKERHTQHKKEEPLKFNGTKVTTLLDCRKLKKEPPADADTVLNILESHLIELIQKQYSTKHDNDVKGGGGRESEQPKKNYYLYIIYK